MSPFLCCIGLAALVVLANFKGEAATCGGELKADSVAKTFNSPGYPSRYPDNTECRWTITAPTGSAIQLTFSGFHLEDSYLDSCDYDYVQIGDKQYCGASSPEAVTSGNNVIVVFHSDDSNGYEGFQATYSAERAVEKVTYTLTYNTLIGINIGSPSITLTLIGTKGRSPPVTLKTGFLIATSHTVSVKADSIGTITQAEVRVEKAALGLDLGVITVTTSDGQRLKFAKKTLSLGLVHLTVQSL